MKRRGFLASLVALFCAPKAAEALPPFTWNGIPMPPSRQPHHLGIYSRPSPRTVARIAGAMQRFNVGDAVVLGTDGKVYRCTAAGVVRDGDEYWFKRDDA